MAPVGLPLAGIAAFFGAVGQFFSSLARIDWGALLIGLACFAVYISARTRAWYAAIHAAYPSERVQWRRLWGAYWATYAVNNVVPFRGGEAIRLVLGKASVPGSSYPAIAASFLVEHVFDAGLAIITLGYAFTQGVFPKPPDFASLGAFDLSFLAARPRLALFLITALAVLGLVAFAMLSARVVSFWERVRRGLVILGDRRRYLREVALVQLVGTVFRLAAYWNFLDAFNIGGSLRNAVLVVAVNTIATALPLTPGGAGVQQALLVQVFSSTASTATVAAYSVGQQLAIAALSVVIGLGSLVLIFGFRTFGEALRYTRATHARERHASRVR